MVAKSITYYQYIIVCCILAYHLGAIHKRRLLRGEGGDPPSKPIYDISLCRKLALRTLCMNDPF